MLIACDQNLMITFSSFDKWLIMTLIIFLMVNIGQNVYQSRSDNLFNQLNHKIQTLNQHTQLLNNYLHQTTNQLHQLNQLSLNPSHQDPQKQRALKGRIKATTQQLTLLTKIKANYDKQWRYHLRAKPNYDSRN
ncbi:hypothetical protein [Candidatus Phytoplasma prunorum]|uniref:hypothetical protein n=1 Tax=Candidatus Phytoplasma prunorum TaxID=47565 RepID=UPI002FEEA712